MFEMTYEEYQEWGEVEPTDALSELFLLSVENSYDWLVNNSDQLHPYLNYLLRRMTKEQFEEYRLSYDQVLDKQFERMEEDEDYNMAADTSVKDKLKEILHIMKKEPKAAQRQ